MRLPVSTWIALDTVSEHRRCARLVQSTRNLASVEHVHRDLRRLLDGAQATKATVAIRVIGRAIVEQQSRQRQAGPRALGLRAERPTRRKETAALRLRGSSVSADRRVEVRWTPYQVFAEDISREALNGRLAATIDSA